MKLLGDKNPNCKFTSKQVIAIRSIYSTGKMVLREIASTFGCSLGNIYKIVSGQTWNWLYSDKQREVLKRIGRFFNLRSRKKYPKDLPKVDVRVNKPNLESQVRTIKPSRVVNLDGLTYEYD